MSVPSKPRIGYENLLRDGSGVITSSGDAVDFPRENLYDWKQYTYWKSLTPGVAWVKVSFAAPKAADYVGLYAQTLYQFGGSWVLQYSLDDIVWTDAHVPVFPTDTTPKFISFNQEFARYWRLLVNSPTAAVVGVCSFGTELVLERGAFVGFSPPTLSQKIDKTVNQAQNGAYLGSTITRKNCEGSLNTESITQLWVRQYWLPFMNHANVGFAWFLSWNDAQFPSEVAYCWADKSLVYPKNTKAGKGFMSIGVSYDGATE